ncbi:hypothetical protein [Ruminococcus sp. NK3A76]|uniref:hypothetical protein n=1 Tax=Ruminococcus sp. NK3A76 TaxID=877411 RepID=UPI00048AF25F|nr:hypothetical protein [Ruminococcus sp. NK3A76]
MELTGGEESSKSFICNLADIDKVTEVPADFESCYFQNGRLIVRGSRVYPGDKGSGNLLESKTLLTAYDENCSPADTYRLASWLTLTNSMSDPLVFAREHTGDEENTAENLLFIDIANGSYARVAMPDEEIIGVTPCFLENGECLIAAESRQEGSDDAGISLISVYTDKLDYEALEKADADTPENNRKQREENQKLLRNFADTIEKKYNIKILLGDDAMSIDFGNVFKAESTEKADSEMSVYKTLMILDDTLAIYPEGFFDKFREEGMNGMSFALVLSMRADGFIESPAGLAMVRDCDHYIALDVCELDANVYIPAIIHELWHSTENQILKKDPSAFDDSNWNELNPDDFSYIENFNEVRIVETPYDKYVLEQDGSDPYFTLKYSMNTPYEDRATLIESLYNGKIAPTPAEAVEVINKEYPHLKAKLDYMAEKMKTNMGVVSWPDSSADQ